MFFDFKRQKTGKDWLSAKGERRLEVLSGDSVINLRKKELYSENESFA